MKNFGIVGVAGYVAPRHLQAIRDTGNELIAAVDPHDSVGILDHFFPEAHFFAEIEEFQFFLETLRYRSGEERVHYVSICSPNYLHEAHVRLALRVGADAICEKPLAIRPSDLDILADLEAETGCKVNTIVQVRLHPVIQNLKKTYECQRIRKRADVCLTYITRRGPWYHVSWKGSKEKSGGLITNIGIHMLDILIWLFGQVEKSIVHLSTPSRMAGALELEWARVRWFLSIDANDLPESYRRTERYALRTLTIDGQEYDFCKGFTGLHTQAYEAILAEQGIGIDDVRPSIELACAISNSETVPHRRDAHPFLTGYFH
jgi:UDP-N-acetyl-2-amino-2-deoxyglucuronate dehydrogenase